MEVVRKNGIAPSSDKRKVITRETKTYILSVRTMNKDIPKSNKRAIYEYLLLNFSEQNGIKKGSFASAAEVFDCSEKSVRRVWKAGQEAKRNGIEFAASFSPKRKERSGRKPKQIDMEAIGDIPLLQRGSQVGLASAMGISQATVSRKLKIGELRRHSNQLKPSLTAENEKNRVRFVLDFVAPNSFEEPKFVDMVDRIHIDEKWFYLTKTSQTFYLLPEEPAPHRSVRHKSHIEKVMFLCAVAKPRGGWDGKLGIWPFVIKEAAERSSVNRPRGTLVTKSINVTRDIYRDFIINKVLPAIRDGWLGTNWERDRPLFLQQDNAKPHIKLDDPEFLREAAGTGLDIRLNFQPSNSPDTNVLDLGFFNAIQSLQQKKRSSNIDQLISNVELSFNELNSDKLFDVFLTLQSCFIEILRNKGSNNYLVPHLGKRKLRVQGSLPEALHIPFEIVRSAEDFVDDSVMIMI